MFSVICTIINSFNSNLARSCDVIDEQDAIIYLTFLYNIIYTYMPTTVKRR